jgi:alpha-L-fucosidase
MKYVVLTSRHHDGFNLFDTQARDYKITSPESLYRRDIVGALAEACHSSGMHFGLYYSQSDWHNADAFTPFGHDRFKAYLETQLTELLSHYGKVDYLFFDGLSPKDPGNAYGGPALNELACRLQPQIIINDRNGPPSDFDTPEQTVGGFRIDRPWETCMTLGTQWSWKPRDEIKSVAECVRILARCAGGDGNLLLNVGPMPTGEIEPRQVDVLKGIGKWLERNGESIYGTRGGPYRPTPTLASTRKGNAVYIHVLEPSVNSVTLPTLPARILAGTLLGGGPVEIRQTGKSLVLLLPERKAAVPCTVIKLVLGRPTDTIPVAMREEPQRSRLQ